MKIELPEHIGEITLGQYQSYHKLTLRTDLTPINFNKRKIAIFTELTFRQLGSVKQKDYKYILEQIDKALTLVPKKFEHRFFINEVEFGMIPNFDNMDMSEFADTSLYPIIEEVDGELVENWENMHRMMAILFRPVVSEDRFDNYKIARYYGTEEHHLAMKQMKLVHVRGGLDFFYRLAKELNLSFQKYIVEAQAKVHKHLSTSISGDGMRQSQN